MSVRKKGRRKIVCDTKLYIWYVALGRGPYPFLTVISDDKQLILACPLHAERSYVISKGKLFQNVKTNGCWNRYCLPFDVPERITPKFVSELIFWATKGSESITIEWDGKTVVA